MVETVIYCPECAQHTPHDDGLCYRDRRNPCNHGLRWLARFFTHLPGDVQRRPGGLTFKRP